MILLLVVYHALCIYTGGWKAPAGVEPNAVYWWLGQLISGFRIETIALVGGYVFSYQSMELGRRLSLPRFAWKKFLRLIIPALIFGAAYYMLFRFDAAHFSWYVFGWKLLNGVGHLWFLPMLFWCFLLSWLIDHALAWLRERNIKAFCAAGWALMVILAGVSLWQPTGVRMGLTRVPHFIFYFYMGYWLRILMSGGAHTGVCAGCSPERSSRAARCAGKRYLWAAVGLAVVYLCVLCLKLQVMKIQLPGMPWVRPDCLNGGTRLTLRALSLVHTPCGILAIFFLVWHLLYGKGDEAAVNRQPGPVLREASRLCYGIYVYHMFFMEWLYFHSPLPGMIASTAAGAWALPWIVLLITLLLAGAATWLTLLLPAGRKMIG